MVLVRYGNEKTTKNFGRMKFHEDTEWSMKRESILREKQLNDAGYYAFITEEKQKETTHYIVWSSQSKRRGSRRK
jgi:hypothetical protein